MIQVHGDYTGIEQEFDRLSKMPSPKAAALLDLVLNSQGVAVRAATHVDTSSLKQSIKDSSDTDIHVWEGTISAGGPSKGINNPVDYAIYEKARGEDHDFFSPLPAFHGLYVTAIREGLRG